jgi:hypothetical protein
MINSLSELKEFLQKNQVSVTEYGGWYLKVGKNTFTMSHGKLSLNQTEVDQKSILKQLKEIKNDNSSNQTRNWRGIGGRNLYRD